MQGNNTWAGEGCFDLCKDTQICCLFVFTPAQSFNDFWYIRVA